MGHADIRINAICANCGGVMEWIQEGATLKIIRCRPCVNQLQADVDKYERNAWDAGAQAAFDYHEGIVPFERERLEAFAKRRQESKAEGASQVSMVEP